MLAALGAATSLLGALQSLTKSKSSSTPSTGAAQTAADPFEITGTGTPASSTPSSGGTGFSPIAPQTMSALIDAQGQASSTSSGSADALQDLFSQIDGNGDGQITKSEFESALGAGGTNLAQADDVFGKLDQNSDGSVSLDELKQALQGSGHGHHHHHVASTSDSSDTSTADSTGTTSDPSADPLMQALDASLSTATNNNSGSSSSSGNTSGASKISLDAAGTANSSYTAMNQLLQREAQAISASMAASLSINV